MRWLSPSQLPAALRPPFILPPDTTLWLLDDTNALHAYVTKAAFMPNYHAVIHVNAPPPYDWQVLQPASLHHSQADAIADAEAHLISRQLPLFKD